MYFYNEKSKMQINNILVLRFMDVISLLFVADLFFNVVVT